jgi:predicted ATPase
MVTTDVSGKFAREMAPENVHRLRIAFIRSVQVLVEVAPELIGAFIPLGKLFGLAGKALAESAGWMDQLDALVEQEGSADQADAPVADQSRILEKVTTFVQQLSTEIPPILFFDDLQWADNASIGLLFHLTGRMEDHRVLILGAYRPTDVALGRDGQRNSLAPVAHELTRY